MLIKPVKNTNYYVEYIPPKQKTRYTECGNTVKNLARYGVCSVCLCKRKPKKLKHSNNLGDNLDIQA